MRERISALGGAVRFGRTDGAGATLEVVVPLNPEGAR
jgi:signal transduction histidine kinase